MTMAGSTSRGFQEFYEGFEKYLGSTPNANYVGLRQEVTGGVHSTRQENGNSMWNLGLNATETDALTLAGEVMWVPEAGGELIIEGRVRVNVVNKASVFFGFSDANTEASDVVIEDEDGTLNTVPSDAVGFLLEGEQSAHWRSVAVKGDNASALVARGEAVENNEWVKLALEINAEGDVWFVVNGKREGDRNEKMIDPTKKFCGMFSADARGTAYNAALDYLYICGPRP